MLIAARFFALDYVSCGTCRICDFVIVCRLLLRLLAFVLGFWFGFGCL